MKKRNLYRKDVSWHYNHRRGHSEPVGGWEGATTGYEVELCSGRYARCRIAPELGIKDIWEAREYAKLYAICESVLDAKFDVVEKAGRRIVLARPALCNRLQFEEKEDE